MSLTISLQHGETIEVGGCRFAADHAARALMAQDGTRIPLSGDPAELIPGVRVHLAHCQRDVLTLALDIPRHVPMRRIANGAAQ